MILSTKFTLLMLIVSLGTVATGFGNPAYALPPIANAGPDQTVSGGSVVTLNGLASSDPDGTPLFFLWAQTAPLSGPFVTLSSSTSGSPTFTAPLLTCTTVFTFTLVVTSGFQFSIDSVNITVLGSGGPTCAPVVNSQVVLAPTGTPVPITLTGSDANGDPLTFSIVTNPTHGGLGVLTNVPPTSATVTYTSDAGFSGLDFFTFRANDGTSNSNTGFVVVIVSSNNFSTFLVSLVAQINGALNANNVSIGNIPANQVAAVVLANNTLPKAQLNTIEFAPAFDVTGASLDITVDNEVPINIQPPPTDELLLYIDVELSGTSGGTPVNFGSTSTYSSSAPPKFTFRADKNLDGSCKQLNLYLLNEATGQWETSPPFVSAGQDDGSQCTYEGTVPHFSTFSVGAGPTGGGGVGSGGGGGGGGPAYVIMDVREPSIVANYYEPESPLAGEDVTILAQILDDVAVTDAKIFYSLKGTKEPEIYQVTMKKISSEWWEGTIDGSEVRTEGISYWVTAADYAGNIENSETSYMTIGKAGPKPEQKITPYTLKTKKPDLKPNDFVELSTLDGKKTISAYSDTIVIRNNSNSPIDSVRLMLSPEIANSFHLDKYSIKSIEPYGNATVVIKLLGNPNKDTYGKPTAYLGNILVMAPNHNPVVLPMKVNSLLNYHHLAYMKKLEEMANQRYRISLINTMLNTGTVEKTDIEVTTRNGLREINTASEEIVIKNTGDRTLTNVRLVTKAGNAFLLDKYSIAQIEPNGEVSIQMIPRIDASKYSSKDYTGEIIIAPENGIPRVIPVHIPAAPRQDSIDEFEVRVDGDELTTALDRIYIKNTGKRMMDSVRIMLSDNLARIFSIDNDTFRTIAPNEEVTVEVKYNANDLKTFMQNYNGEIKIVSEHHNMRTIPMNIQWNKVQSDNFIVYARNGDLAIAEEVSKYLESNYQKVTSAFGTVNHKATIYMTGSMEEMQLPNNGYSFFSYSNDAIFICSCDNAKENALQEFIYRAMIMNYPSYHNMKKIENDNGNWLMDGIAKYMTVKNDEAKYLDAFKEDPVEFQWYGSPTDAEYGSAITFFKYLEETYGEEAIYSSLYHLGSGMVSNTRCDTVENCAVLWAVYDANGWNINNKRYDLDFNMIVKEWTSYVAEQYDISR